jgi:hypothetical protein
MADELPVPETLETIAASLRELRTTMETRFDRVDERFGKVDERFSTIDVRLDEMKAQLRTEIESVRGDVRLIAEGVGANTVLLQGLDKSHRRLEERVDGHDVRIAALEPKKRA